MIDYVTLMLLNMAAALILIALFICCGLTKENNKEWTAPFFISGLVATVTGFVMTFTWPLPSPFNIAYGEMTILLGVLLLGTGLTVAKQWDLLPVSVYALIAGLAAMIIGVRFIDLGLSQTPVLAGLGFIMTGLCGVCSILVVKFKHLLWLRLCGALVLFAAAGIWLYIDALAYWSHLKVN